MGCAGVSSPVPSNPSGPGSVIGLNPTIKIPLPAPTFWILSKVIWLVWRAVKILSMASAAFWRATLSYCTVVVLPIAMAKVASTASNPIISTTIAIRVSSKENPCCLGLAAVRRRLLALATPGIVVHAVVIVRAIWDLPRLWSDAIPESCPWLRTT